MHLQSANAEPREAIYFGVCVGNKTWMHRAKREKAIRRDGTVICDPVIHFWRKTDYFGADIINQAGALDSQRIQKSEKCFRVGGVALDIRKILASLLDERQ